MTGAAAHSLTVERVSKRYGRVMALDDVSLEVPRGEFLTFLGPSGSGKTTLLMTIAGFTEPTSGEILVDGTPITHLPPEKRNFGMVFQGYALFPHMSVAQNVRFPLAVRRVNKTEARRRVEEVLAVVQLSHLADRKPTQLSGGQQQRVALARALVFDPDILLLDEPLSALDKKLRKDLQFELKELHNRIGRTFIYVTHDQEEALSMSDRVAIISDGRIVQSGAPRELYDRPGTVFVADFLGKSNFLNGQVASVEADAVHYSVGDSRFVQRRGENRVTPGESITVALRPEKAQVLDPGAGDEQGNRVRGTITGWSFYGTSYDLRVHTDAVGDLAVEVPAWRSAVEPREGLAVDVVWAPDSSVIVKSA